MPHNVPGSFKLRRRIDCWEDEHIDTKRTQVAQRRIASCRDRRNDYRAGALGVTPEILAHGLASKSEFSRAAPKARNMIARGKRQAQRGASPLVSRNKWKRALKVRNITAKYSALSELSRSLHFFPGRRASLRSALAPGYHIPRLWRCAWRIDERFQAASASGPSSYYLIHYLIN